MRTRWRAAGAALLLAWALVPRVSAAPAARPRPVTPAPPTIAILCYHDVTADNGRPLQDVSPEFLREQIRLCKAQGWTFMRLSELVARRAFPEALPPRVMVLTFDDGYRSVLEHVLPVLQQEGVPGTFAPITSFVGHEHPELPPLLSWDELRRLEASGLAEIASHSHALHQYEWSNPQHDSGPAVTTRRWLPEANRYEDREQYRDRIGADLTASQRALKSELGHPVNVLVWPYGRYNDMARAQAEIAGFAVSLSLEARAVTAQDLLRGCLPRVMVTRKTNFADPALGWLPELPEPVRMAEIDLESLWDPDERTFRARLDLAVTRARALGATDVLLPFGPDPRRDGQMVRAYAMNHQVPLLADVWAMAAAKFAAAPMKLWVRVPSLNQSLAWTRRPEWRLAADGDGALARRWGTRLSPELPATHSAAMDLLSDLAVYLPFDGVVFDDDAAVGAREHLASDTAAAPARQRDEVRALLEDCKRAVRAWRPGARFARVVPAAAFERSGVDPGTSIDLGDCLEHDDLVLFETSNAVRDGSPAAIERLARRAVTRWRAMGRPGEAPIVFMLAARDPDTHAWIPAARQQGQATAAQRGGLVHLGTTPVTSEGELPLGLLDTRTRVSTVKAASRRR
ncbi:MAG: polysaccharide deacetylase family protein [Candidatus Eisenbacteria bacterium]